MSWQELLRQRLIERNSRESVYAGVIEQYRRLAQQTRLLKERNQSLLRAVNSVKSNLNSSTVMVGEDNPVRAAYVTSLESQISSLRDELAAVYKTQTQNAQRLLAMNETLREKEELSRTEGDSLRKAQDELTILRRKVHDHDEIMAEKNRNIQILHDEIATLELELTQVQQREDKFKLDNANMLQKWVDLMSADDGDKVNEANAFYEDMRARGVNHNPAMVANQNQVTRRKSQDSMSTTSSASFVSGNDEGMMGTRSLPHKGGAANLTGEGLRLHPNG